MCVAGAGGHGTADAPHELVREEEERHLRVQVEAEVLRLVLAHLPRLEHAPLHQRPAGARQEPQMTIAFARWRESKR